MSLVADYFRELYAATIRGWNRFWFTPADPATLALIRILAGAMLFYTHLVWTLELDAFFGENAWISPAAAAAFVGEGSFAWSYLWWIQSPTLLWIAHLAALVVFFMLTVGAFTRLTSVLAWLIAVAYVNRIPGATFGLDKINVMLAMYLMVGPSGAMWSVDRWRARRSGEVEGKPVPSVSANIAIRLIQLHMCVIYLFAGLAKLQGLAWVNGTAMWGAVANLEYQSLDMTWLAAHPLLIAAMTHLTVYWEVSFCALVWPRLTRPIVLAIAIPLHLGIAIFLGMITFGLVMLIGCASFIPPWLVRRMLPGGAGEGMGSTEREPISAVRKMASRQPRVTVRE